MIENAKIINKILTGFYTATSFNEFSRMMGRIAGLRLPGPVMKAVIAAYRGYFNIDLSDVEIKEWDSMNAFFTRHLRPGTRPVDQNPGVMVSPADGSIQSFGIVTNGVALQVKGIAYQVGELLGDKKQARGFENGSFCTIYLSPADYHRVHSPVDGRILSARYIPGRLFSVNPKVGKYCDNFLTRNERVVLTIDTDTFGEVVLVMVGAAGVGSMDITAFPEISTDKGEKPNFFTRKPPVEVKKGEEAGVFNMGSTVVVFSHANTEYIGNAIGESIRYGQALLRVSED